MGKKSPSTPPTYEKEKSAFSQSEFSKRQNEASAYNAAINNYNTQLGSLNSSLNSLGNSIRNSTIVQDEDWGGYTQQLQSLENQYNAYNSGLSQYANAPNWSSTVNSAYGAVDVGMPTLSAKDNSLATTFGTQLADLRGVLAGLKNDRKAEQQRIDSYSSGLASQLSGLGSTIGGLNYYDASGVNAAKSSLAQALSGVNGFSSSILGEYKPNAISDFQNQIAGYQSQLSGLDTQRGVEQDRINQYNTGLGSAFDAMNSQFAGLAIKDIDQMNALQQAIDAKQLDASRFNSPLSYNFNSNLQSLGDLEARLGSLFSQRTAEQNRVSTAQQQANAGITNILGQLGQADIYNAGLLNQIGLAINSGRNDINNFSSVLGADFGGVTSQLGDAEAQLQALRDQRSQALNGYSTNISDLTGQIGSYNLWDESNLQTGRNSAAQYLSQLAQFTGSDVNQYRTQAQAAYDLAGKRISDLGNERASIENSARSLLTDAKTRGYYGSSDIDALAAELKAISERQSQYGATQALDEIDGITGLIGTERNRLKTEEASAAAAAQAEKDAYLKAQAPTGYLYNGGNSYASWLANWRNGDSGMFADLPSSFARALSVQYI